jgi:hypothetical protein
MTNCQVKMDQAIKEKYAVARQVASASSGEVQAAQKQLFKLKRFLEVDPRTSTKRGEQPFASQLKK